MPRNPGDPFPRANDPIEAHEVRSSIQRVVSSQEDQRLTLETIREAVVGSTDGKNPGIHRRIDTLDQKLGAIGTEVNDQGERLDDAENGIGNGEARLLTLETGAKRLDERLASAECKIADLGPRMLQASSDLAALTDDRKEAKTRRLTLWNGFAIAFGGGGALKALEFLMNSLMHQHGGK